MAFQQTNPIPEFNAPTQGSESRFPSLHSGCTPVAVPPRTVFDEFMRWTIGGEREALAPRLAPADREAFLGYYSKLPDPRNEAAVRRFLRGLWNADTGWVARRIASLAHSRTAGGEPVRLLDAGSGFGTFSMLYASMGAHVVAADLRDDRLRVARERLALYAEHTGRRLEVDNVLSDVTQEMGPDFDVVWVYNAISHIDPVEPFLQGVARRLAPEGVLVIGDINGANPQHTQRLDALRDEVHGSYTDDAGVVHRYAHERTFTPNEFRDILGACGLDVVHHELLYGGEGRLPAPLLGCVRAAVRMSGSGQRLARRQFVVARARGKRPAA